MKMKQTTTGPELTTAVLLFGAAGTGNELYFIDNVFTADRVKVRGYNRMLKARAELEGRLVQAVKETAVKYPERLTAARIESFNGLRDMYGKKVFNF